MLPPQQEVPFRMALQRQVVEVTSSFQQGARLRKKGSGRLKVATHELKASFHA